jgi:hypothetical protein
MSDWERWQCPCPECNGYVPWLRPDDEDDDSMMEPEHPENVEPRPVSFWFYA